MRPSLNFDAFDSHTYESGSFTTQHTEEYYVCFWDYLTWGFLLLPTAAGDFQLEKASLPHVPA